MIQFYDKFVYNKIITNLTSYINLNLGKKVIIHGDPVFTNILINQFGKIKFIDMRGKQGEILSIEGDWLYDWAKLYQSLIGYDKILMGKIINETYEKKMIDYFETYFIKLYSEKDLCNFLIKNNKIKARIKDIIKLRLFVFNLTFFSCNIKKSIEETRNFLLLFFI